MNFKQLFNRKKALSIKNHNTRFFYTKNQTKLEKEEYIKTIVQIKSFWKAFLINESEISDFLSGKNHFKLIEFMDKHINLIHPDVLWEFGASNTIEGFILVISSKKNKSISQLIETIIDSAPVLEHWEFLSYKPIEKIEIAKKYLLNKTKDSVDDFQFQIYINEYNQIDLFFLRTSAISDTKIEKAYQSIYILLECIIGEENLNKWIGIIEVNPIAQKDNSEIYNIDRLQEHVLNEIKKMQISLPTNFYFDRFQNSEWNSYKIVNNTGNTAKNDLVSAYTMDPKVFKTFQSKIPFYGERFSSKKETFCFLKVENSGKNEEEIKMFKAELEDSLNEVLISNGIGCTIGAGIGSHFFYIDFALKDLTEGIYAIRAAMILKNISKKSWILFNDSNLVSEWIGIYSDSPNPFIK